MIPTCRLFPLIPRKGSRSVLTTFVLLVACGPAIAQAPPTAQPGKPPQEPPKATPKPYVAEAHRPDKDLDQKINQAREEIELMQLQLDTRRAQLHLAEAGWRNPIAGRRRFI